MSSAGIAAIIGAVILVIAKFGEIWIKHRLEVADDRASADARPAEVPSNTGCAGVAALFLHLLAWVTALFLVALAFIFFIYPAISGPAR